jgi:hypothetical protein
MLVNSYLTNFKCFSFFTFGNCLLLFRMCQRFVAKYLETNVPTIFEGEGRNKLFEQNEYHKSLISHNEFTHKLQRIDTISIEFQIQNLH